MIFVLAQELDAKLSAQLADTKANLDASSNLLRSDIQTQLQAAAVHLELRCVYFARACVRC